MSTGVWNELYLVAIGVVGRNSWPVVFVQRGDVVVVEARLLLRLLLLLRGLD
jgi:hypothetical protein